MYVPQPLCIHRTHPQRLIGDEWPWGPRPAYCRITSAPARKHSRPRSGSTCRGNIHLYGTICISTLSASTPRLVHSHLPRAMFDIDFHARPPPRPPRLRSLSPLTSQKGHRSSTSTSATVALASKASAASATRPPIKYSSALQPLPEVNPLPTTPSTLPSGYLFFPAFIYIYPDRRRLSQTRN